MWVTYLEALGQAVAGHGAAVVLLQERETKKKEHKLRAARR
jgi:hypothetical protein